LLNESWPLEFWAHARLMFAARPPVSALAGVVSVVAALLLTRGYLRRLLVAWCGLAIVALLNPLVAPFLIEHVTSPNIYWRLFYLLPFPLVVGLAAAAWSASMEQPRTRLAATIAIVFGGLLLHFVPGSPSVYHDKPGDQHRSELGAPRYNVDTDKLRIAAEIAAIAPSGPMLAPQRVSVYVPMVSTEHPQVVTRDSEMLTWITGLGQPKGVAEDRLKAARLLAAFDEDVGHLERVLDRQQIRSVVATAPALARGAVRSVLDQRGFAETARVGEWVLLTRP